MAVTLDDLRAICGTGLAHLHAWASYELPPSLATVTTRPQREFRPERLMLPGNTSDRWRIHDIRVGNRNRIAIAGNAINVNGVRLDVGVVAVDQDLAICVEYVGDVEDGEEFIGAFFGQCGDGTRQALAVQSGVPIRAAIDCGRRVLMDLGDNIYRFEERKGTLDRIAVADAKELAALRTRVELARLAEVVSPYETDSTMSVLSAPKHPLMISLRAEAFNDEGHVLFGTDEATGAVVFDLCHRPRAFTTKCDLAGYTPNWWDAVRR